MAESFKIRTTRNSILCAIMRNQEGPIPLWHFASRENKDHKKNLNTLQNELSGPCPAVYELAGAYWKLIYRKVGNDFLAELQRLPEGWTPEKEAPHRAQAVDPKAKWIEGLIARGWMGTTPARPAAHNPQQPISTGYDFSNEGD